MSRLLSVLILVILFITNTAEATVEEILTVAEVGNLDSIKILIQQDQSLIEAADDAGYTPLHEAAYAGHLDIVHYLLSQKASASVASNSGSTPLHGAAYYGHLLIVESLVEAGANVNAQNAGGYTPLLSAIARRQTDIALTLIGYGADPNVISPNGQTLLIIAPESGTES